MYGCIALYFVLISISYLNAYDYCSKYGRYHPLCGNDCLRMPLMCKDKDAKGEYTHLIVEINSRHITEMTKALNEMRQQAVKGTLTYKTQIYQKSESRAKKGKWVDINHTFKKAKQLNEIVSQVE